MTMASAGQLITQLHGVAAQVKTLMNAQLKSILRTEGLAVSGTKVVMQDRIISRMLSQAILLPFPLETGRPAHHIMTSGWVYYIMPKLLLNRLNVQ